MIGYTDAPRAWWMTRGMARVAGVNLPQAVIDGWLTREELATIVARCEGCTCLSRCDTWLAGSGASKRMPEFCPNKSSIEALCPN
ncbi:DUF6455 family protein [Rhodopseudomonas palustris]